MTIPVILAMSLLGALAWRFRGGGFIRTGSTQLARIGCALALALPLAAIAESWWMLGIAATLFIGCALVGWGDFMDMGHTSPKSEELLSLMVRWLGPGSLKHDVAGMTLSVALALAPTTAYLAWLGVGWPWMALPALSGGAIYALAWQIIPPWHSPTEQGELALGALLGFALTASVIL